MRTTKFGFSFMKLKSGIVFACSMVLIVAASATAGCASSNSEDPSNSEEQNLLISEERAELMAETAYSQSVRCYQRRELTRSECSERAYMSVCEDESAEAGWSAADEERCRDEVRDMTELLLDYGLL